LDLTQEKVIQAMGRIGRNNVQQTYTIRFRDDTQISKLFTDDTEKPEVINMNRLFNSSCVKYEDGMYVEIAEDNDEKLETSTEEGECVENDKDDDKDDDEYEYDVVQDVDYDEDS
jgi:hypothetical protein